MADSLLKVRMLKLHFLECINYIYIGIDEQTNKAFVVDPAWDLEAIEKCLIEEHAVLDKILITHSHVDHVNLADKMTSKYDVPVYMSQAEIDYYHYRCKNLHGFVDGERLVIGKSEVQCILTPGHTKGGTCYLSGGNVFTGDTVFVEGCGICRFEGGSAEEMYVSFQKLKKIVSDDTIVYPGHRYKEKPGQRMDFVKDHNIYFAISDIEQFVKFRNRPNAKRQFSFI